MKILIELSSLNDNFSGIERYAKNMAQNMVAQDSDNHYILLFKNEVHKSFLNFEKDYNNVEIVVLSGDNKLIYYQYTLYRYLKKIKVDRYVFFAFQSPWLLKKKGIFNTIHDVACFDCPETMKYFQRIYFKFSYRIAAWVSSGIITVSEFSKNRIVSILGIQENKVYVIHSGLEENFFVEGTNNSSFEDVKNRYQLPDEYLLCLSTLEPRKNMQLLIQAYKELVLEGYELPKLVMVGRKGWMVDNLLDQMGDSVIVTGFVENEDLPALYQNSKLFVFPSLYEGFGLPPVEALAMGACVLSSDAASLPEVLGSNAIYFNNNDIVSLKESLKNSLGSAPLDEEIESARNWALGYTFDKSASKILTILSKQD